MSPDPTAAPAPPSARTPRWVGPALLGLTAVVVALLALLAASIMERRWEAQRPSLVLKPIAAYEPDNSVWGQNYPREYETYRRTADDTTRTTYGGGVPRDYLDEDPWQVLLFAGYGFSMDYRQGRGHAHALADVLETKRIKTPYNPGTCMTCKSTDVPRLMAQLGVKEFYASNFHDLKAQVKHPIGCQDCHDPATMNLRITRPALREAFAARGQDIDQATHQQLRSLVCAQCHVEYYFAPEPKDYLVLPWARGTTVEDMLAYYDERGFADWVHPLSRTPMIKSQHPDYEFWSTGVHAFRGVSCADCHMPYKSEGGLKFTDHHVQSPLLNIANSCSVCHRWSEQDVLQRVTAIQDKVARARLTTEEHLVKAHLDIAAAMEAGAGDAELEAPRRLLRHAQFRWDYVASNNGMGFHSPQESLRILADAIAGSAEARLAVARLLAAKGLALPAQPPDVSTRAKAWALAAAYIAGTAPRLLPAGAATR